MKAQRPHGPSARSLGAFNRVAALVKGKAPLGVMRRSGAIQRGLASALAIAVILAVASTAGHAATPQVPGACPAVMQVSDVRKGMTGTGWTVVQGQTPQSFNVEVLGVLRNGIGPGRDMIVVDTSPAANPSPIIDAHGGIWFGMSGSPIYVGGQLLGAVAYGLSFGPSSIAGVTPAQDMASILGYGSPSSSAPSSSTAPPNAERVRIPTAMKKTIAASTGGSAGTVGGSLVQLKMPVSISGIFPTRSKKIARIFAKKHLPLIPYTGSSAAAGTTASAAPRPGGNFAAAISYGDVTFAGVGTTTYVCNGKALAFGHPFFWTGPTSMGANSANAITVVNDPVFGSYKLANVGRGFGTLDQDRLAGVRADLGTLPSVIPITSFTTALDTGRHRWGRTAVTTSEFVPDLAFFHLFSNIDSTFDQVGAGSSSLAWTITGTTASGHSWKLTRSNLYTSQYDISSGSVLEVAGELYELLHNKFEKVSFTGVHVTQRVQRAIRQFKIGKVLVSRNGGPYQSVKMMTVHRGDHLGLRVTLTPYVGTTTKTVALKVHVPWTAKQGGSLVVSGGSSGSRFCFFGGCGTGSGGVTSVEGLISKIEGAPHNNDLLARLQLGKATASRGIARQGQVVVGSHSIGIRLK